MNAEMKIKQRLKNPKQIQRDAPRSHHAGNVGRAWVTVGVCLLLGVSALGCGGKLSDSASRGVGRYVTVEERGVEGVSCHPSQPALSWAVVIGVNEYQDERIADLSGAVADAWNVYHALVSPQGGRVARSRAKLLLNEEASKRGVEDALGHFLTNACPQDMITIYFAGHGAPEPKRPTEPFLLVHNSDLDSLASTAIAMSQLPQFLKWRNEEASRLLFIVDACHSGNISFPGSRGFAPTKKIAQERAKQVTQSIAKVSKEHTGWGVIAATAPDQVASEGGEGSARCVLGGRPYQGGAFTCALLDGLGGEADRDQDQAVSYDELFTHLSQRLRGLRGASQTPQRSGDLTGELKVFKERSGPILLPPLPERYKRAQVRWSAEPWAYGSLATSLLSLGVGLIKQREANSLNAKLNAFLTDPTRVIRTEAAYQAEVAKRDASQQSAQSWAIAGGALGAVSLGLAIWEASQVLPDDDEVYAQEPSIILNPMQNTPLGLHEPRPLKEPSEAHVSSTDKSRETP